MEKIGRRTFQEQWLAPKLGKIEGCAMGRLEVERCIGTNQEQGKERKGELEEE